MQTDVSFGLWVQRRRKALDLTREELARKIGSSPSTLRKIESDERRPSKQLAELLADALEVPADEKGLFIRIARGESSPEKLKNSTPISALDQLQRPQIFPKPIPIPPTPLIGREAELAALRQMLADPQCRLITLVGPGGSGKTRIGLQVATELYEEAHDRACFVPLAGVRDPAFIVPNIAEFLHFSFSGAMDPREQLLVHLESKVLLLVLDNFEQLLDGVDLLADISHRARGIKLLVTSRERLNLHGEWLFEVRGLQSPPENEQDILNYGATALFVETARRTSGDFAPTAADGPAITRICNLVEGMPLGIELAAAWVRTLSCQEISEEVERNLDFLATPMHGIPDRHRSMRAAFDHSWNLLSEAEQSALLQLSVFRSGFQREAGWQVAGADLSRLSALLDKSLLRRTPEGRYEVHELLRQYAEAKQTERPGELEAARDRHSAYYADLVQRLHADLISERQMKALAETSAEMNNIRAAWQHAVHCEAAPDIHKFIRGLWQFYEIRGWFKEADATFRWAMENVKDWSRSVDRTEPVVVVLREYLRAHYIWFSMRLGQWGEASRLSQECIVQLRKFEALPELAAVLHLASVALWGTGKYAEARILLEEKIPLEMKLERPWDLAMGYGQLGLVFQGMGDFHKARDLMGSAQQLLEDCGDQRMIAVSLFHRAGVESDLGEYEAAREMLERSLALSTQVGDRWTMGTSRLQLGIVAQAQGKHEQAVGWFQEVLGFFQETGDHWSRLRALNGLGTSLLALDDDRGARQAFREALAAAVEAELWPDAVKALVGFANLQVKQGALEPALVMLEQAVQHPACSQPARERARKLREEIEPHLAAGQIEEAMARAHAEPFEGFVTGILETS